MRGRIRYGRTESEGSDKEQDPTEKDHSCIISLLTGAVGSQLAPQRPVPLTLMCEVGT